MYVDFLCRLAADYQKYVKPSLKGLMLVEIMDLSGVKF